MNTAFVERVNLTLRRSVAALARRTWATRQQAPPLLAPVEWWRAYYHCGWARYGQARQVLPLLAS